MTKDDIDLQKFMDKVKESEKGHKLDLSSGEDLSIGIMNLISLEEHLFFTAKKTGDSKFWDMLDEIRQMRVSLMKRIIKDYGGEVWCMSKHLLAASMRLMEVGTKALKKDDMAEAEEMFEKAYQLYNLFWGVNLGLVDPSASLRTSSEDVSANEKELLFVDEGEKPQLAGKASIFDKLGAIVKKAVNCCRE